MFKIERAKINDIEEISDLVKRIYLKYNSKIDSEEGINNILTFMSKENMRLRFYIEGALMLVARDKNNKIVGAIELKNFEHISLFFYHKDMERKSAMMRRHYWQYIFTAV